LLSAYAPLFGGLFLILRTGILSLVFLTACILAGVELRHPSGFRVDLPQGWQAIPSSKGHIVLVSPNPQAYAFVQPVLNRAAGCAAILRSTLTGAGAAAYNGLTNLDVVPAGVRMATAKFLFQNGGVRGTILCAETSSRSAMLYGIAAPVREYPQWTPVLMSVLRSFSFAPNTPAAGGGASPIPMPALNTTWQEPHEMAYTLAIPQGWRATGGIRRLDVTHYNTGVQITSPDNTALIRLGDQRLGQCTVPGPGAATMPSTGGLNYCAQQSGQQLGASYLRTLAQDLGLRDGQVISNTNRPDLAQRAQAVPASFGLRVNCSVAEFRFRATRNGVPVEGALFAQTTLFYAVQGQNFILGTQSFDISGFLGPANQMPMLARLTGAIRASQRINPVWWSQTQQINREVAQRTLATLHAEAEHQQQAFWERMASMDRRREAVNDILGGTVRLTDGQGHQYQAKAGSNYYFLDTEAERTAGRPDDAVRGADVWPSPMVDLRPLEVVR
jgi:uncharacterized cupin superfamily protein